MQPASGAERGHAYGVRGPGAPGLPAPAVVVAEAVSVLGESGGEAVDFAAVNGLKATAGGVGEHFFGEAGDHLWLALEEHRFVFSETLNFATIREAISSCNQDA